jgi:hypothetical protein
MLQRESRDAKATLARHLAQKRGRNSTGDRRSAKKVPDTFFSPPFFPPHHRAAGARPLQRGTTTTPACDRPYSESYAAHGLIGSQRQEAAKPSASRRFYTVSAVSNATVPQVAHSLALLWPPRGSKAGQSVPPRWQLEASRHHALDGEILVERLPTQRCATDLQPNLSQLRFTCIPQTAESIRRESPVVSG